MKRRAIIGFFILLILVISVFLLYKSGFREGQVVLEIEAPEETVSGIEVEYKLVLENKNNFDLRDATLVFSYPEDSIPLEGGQPFNSLKKTFDFDTFESRSRQDFSFKAILSGDKGQTKKAKAILTYSPSNLNSVFQKNAEASTTISEVIVSLDLSAPPGILSGQTVQISLDLRNESDEDLGDLQIIFAYPDGFSFIGANPVVSEDNNKFNLDSLEAGAGKRITIDGRITGFEKEGKRFTAVLRKKIGERFYDLQKAQILLTVSSPLLTTEISVNGGQNYTAELGENLKYTVKFSNNSNNHFSALELSVKLEGQMFDLASIKSDGFFDQNNRTILWNAAAVPALADLGPNQNGEVSFDVKLKNEFLKSFSKDYSLKVGSFIQTSSVPPDFNLDKITASANLVSKIKAKTDFTVQAFYDDSVFSNSGPTPPQVGQKTTYTVHWKIINEGNDLTSVNVLSFLLPGITWENNFKTTPSQPNLSYNPSTGRLSWIIPTVPAGTGIVSPTFEAVFQVGITPSVNQVGQSPELIKEVSFEAVDNFTKEDIKLSRPAINTQATDSAGTVGN